jgi:hypothetical protein
MPGSKKVGSFHFYPVGDQGSKKALPLPLKDIGATIDAPTMAQHCRRNKTIRRLWYQKTDLSIFQERCRFFHLRGCYLSSQTCARHLLSSTVEKVRRRVIMPDEISHCRLVSEGSSSGSRLHSITRNLTGRGHRSVFLLDYLEEALVRIVLVLQR